MYISKWDNLDCFLPYRYFLSWAWWSGEWPFWNPFQHLGYPAYSDLQSGVFSPIVWLITLFGKYTVTSLTVELLIYYLFAVIGAYKFSGLFVRSEKARIFISVSYVLSGFMIGTSQIMVFIAGAAFLPHILYHFVRLFKLSHWKDTFYLVLFTALHVTSASPAYTIVLVYIVAAICIYYGVKRLRENQLTTFPFLKLGAAALLLVVLLLPYINSLYEFWPFFNRSEKLPFGNFLLSNPFGLEEYISFIYPFATLSDSEWFGNTGMTMRNGYFGIIGLVFMIYSVRFIKERKVFILFLTSSIFLLLAAGGTTPLYQYFYELPGFGLFRHPSFFRSHALLFLICLAGIGFDRWNPANLKENGVKYLTIGFLFLLGCTLVWVLLSPHVNDYKSLFTHWDFSDDPVRHYMKTFILLNLLILIPVLSLSVVSIGMKKRVKRFLLILAVVDLVVVTQIMSPYTIHNRHKHHDYVTYFSNIPDTIRQGSAVTPLYELEQKHLHPKINGIWRNTATYHKSLTFQGTNPTQTKGFNILEQNGGLEITIRNPLFYDARKKVDISDNPDVESNLIWEMNGSKDFEVNENSLIIDSVNIGINSFSCYVKNISETEDILIMNQNYHDLWSATLAGNEEAKILLVNEALMGVLIPRRYNGQVNFNFNSPRTKVLFFISLLAYLMLIFLILKASKRGVSKQNK